MMQNQTDPTRRGMQPPAWSVATRQLSDDILHFFSVSGSWCPIHRLVQAVDSVSVCLSKGLGAPVGSVIVGTKSFIARERILRKTLGGGMRQVGNLCAATLVALQENVGKLGNDHKNARTLVEGINKIKRLKVDVASVETNIVYFEILEGSNITALKLGKIMEEHGILLMLDSSSR